MNGRSNLIRGDYILGGERASDHLRLDGDTDGGGNGGYGVSPITLVATGGASGSAVVFSVVSGPGTVSGSTLTVTGVGTIVVAANQAGNTNYSAATLVTKSVVVNQASQTITFTAPTTPVVYGVSPITLVATGGASGNAVTFSVASGPGTVNGSTLTVTGVGTIVVAANQAGNANYAAATQVTQPVVVNQASQTINFTAPASPVVYGVLPITLVATGGASGNPVTFSIVSGPGTVAGSTLTVTGVGTIVVAANQAGNANYSAAPQVTQSVVVNVAGVAATPTFSPVAGTYTAAQSVTISDTTTGATIYYTTNGTHADHEFTVYSGAITVASTETLEAIAAATGYTTSAVASAVYTIANPAPRSAASRRRLPTLAAQRLRSPSTGQDSSQARRSIGVPRPSPPHTSARPSLRHRFQRLILPLRGPTLLRCRLPRRAVGHPTHGSSKWIPLVRNNRCANHHLGHGDSDCRFHGQLSGNRAILRDQRLRNLPEPSYGSDLQLLLDHQYGDDRHVLDHAQGNVSDHRGLYGNGNQCGLPAANSSAASWVHEEKMAARGIWLTACLGLVLLASAALSIGCGRGGGGGSSTPPATQQVTSSGAVSLTIQKRIQAALDRTYRALRGNRVPVLQSDSGVDSA
jgi:hypothetical protein